MEREQRGSYYGTDLFHIWLDALARDFIRPSCGCLGSPGAVAVSVEFLYSFSVAKIRKVNLFFRSTS
jgi:hypothetical protein